MGLKDRTLQRLGREHRVRLALVATLASVCQLACSVYDASLLTGSSAISAGDGGSGGELAGTDAGGTVPMATAGSDAVDAGGELEAGSGGPGEAGATGAAAGGAGGTPSDGGGSGRLGLGGGGMGGGGMGGGGMGGGGMGGGGMGGGGMGGGAGGVSGSGGSTQELALGKKATASSQQVGNEPAKGNDSDVTTRWCASGGSFPQWWRADLGATHVLTQVSIRFEHSDRKYSYVVETSPNDAVYTQQATVNGTGAVQTVDLPAGVSARYLRITVTSAASLVDATGTHPSWASFFEISLQGY